MPKKVPDQNIEKVSNKLYKAGPDVHDLLRDLVKQYHHDLMHIVDQIVVLFKDTAPEDRIAVVAKASPKLSVLAASPCIFTVEIGYNRWEKLTNLQQIALIDRCLCAMESKENPDGGNSYKVLKPDVSYYRDEVARHGFWIYSPEKPDVSTLASMIERVFGDDHGQDEDEEDDEP